MHGTHVAVQDGLLKRILWLYGLYTIPANASFLIGFYLLPEGVLRSTPTGAVARVAAAPHGFWGQFTLTLLINLSWGFILTAVLNLNRIRGIPAGYLIPMVAGIISGLVLGTDSFAADDLSKYKNVRAALALGLTIGGLEMLAYVMVAAATVRLGIYEYESWWRWGGPYKPIKLMRFSEIRLAGSELACVAVALLLLIIAAWRETAMVR